MNEPFFKRQGEHFHPTPASRGPWNPNSLHGRVIAGLLGHVLEERHGDADFIPARLTVDMYRLPDFSPVEVSTRVVREGGRIRVVDAEWISGGVSQARATCQFLRKTANPPGRTWSPAPWDAPDPDSMPAPEDPRMAMNGMWAMRQVGEGIRGHGPRKAWMKEVRELVEGVPHTPFTRVAVACDFASPFANASDSGLGYINTDVTLYLHRAPVGEWVGFESMNHHATDGVAIGECFLHDTQGPIGSAAVAALAQRPPSRG
ncbi:MAG: acyl-CoA thioesterase domain-containing protein [Phenylobacterium sp.]|uniref:acyl-CoA thioesterase domain-containing protein n=1 Tax=Phenylobacterium sp. TaxID=1871053 RepID=UPI00391927DB